MQSGWGNDKTGRGRDLNLSIGWGNEKTGRARDLYNYICVLELLVAEDHKAQVTEIYFCVNWFSLLLLNTIRPLPAFIIVIKLN